MSPCGKLKIESLIDVMKEDEVMIWTHMTSDNKIRCDRKMKGANCTFLCLLLPEVKQEFKIDNILRKCENSNPVSFGQ